MPRRHTERRRADQPSAWSRGRSKILLVVAGMVLAALYVGAGVGGNEPRPPPFSRDEALQDVRRELGEQWAAQERQREEEVGRHLGGLRTSRTKPKKRANASSHPVPTDETLRVLSLDAAAVLHNPLGPWITPLDTEHAAVVNAMKDFAVQGVSAVGVRAVFTATLYDELLMELHRAGYQGLEVLDAMYHGGSFEGGVRTTHDALTKAHKMAQVVAVAVGDSAIAVRPSPATCYVGDVHTVLSWWSPWRDYVFRTPGMKERIEAEAKATGRLPAALVLSTAVYDAALINTLGKVAPRWVAVRERVCKGLSSKGGDLFVDIVQAQQDTSDILLLHNVPSEAVGSLQRRLLRYSMAVSDKDRPASAVVLTRKSRLYGAGTGELKESFTPRRPAVENRLVALTTCLNSANTQVLAAVLPPDVDPWGVAKAYRHRRVIVSSSGGLHTLQHDFKVGSLQKLPGPYPGMGTPLGSGAVHAVLHLMDIDEEARAGIAAEGDDETPPPPVAPPALPTPVANCSGSHAAITSTFARVCAVTVEGGNAVVAVLEHKFEGQWVPVVTSHGLLVEEKRVRFTNYSAHPKTVAILAHDARYQSEYKVELSLAKIQAGRRTVFPTVRAKVLAIFPYSREGTPVHSIEAELTFDPPPSSTPGNRAFQWMPSRHPIGHPEAVASMYDFLHPAVVSVARGQGMAALVELGTIDEQKKKGVWSLPTVVDLRTGAAARGEGPGEGVYGDDVPSVAYLGLASVKRDEEEGVSYRDKRRTLLCPPPHAGGDTHVLVTFQVIFSASTTPSDILAAALERMWAQNSRRIREAPLQPVHPRDYYADMHESTAIKVVDNQTIAGPVDADRTTHFQPWDNAVSAAYGMAFWGTLLHNTSLVHLADGIVSLALSRNVTSNGTYPSAYRWTSQHWAEPHPSAASSTAHWLKMYLDTSPPPPLRDTLQRWLSHASSLPPPEPLSAGLLGQEEGARKKAARKVAMDLLWKRDDSEVGVGCAQRSAAVDLYSGVRNMQAVVLQQAADLFLQLKAPRGAEDEGWLEYGEEVLQHLLLHQRVSTGCLGALGDDASPRPVPTIANYYTATGRISYLERAVALAHAPMYSTECTSPCLSREGLRLEVGTALAYLTRHFGNVWVDVAGKHVVGIDRTNATAVWKKGGEVAIEVASPLNLSALRVCFGPAKALKPISVVVNDRSYGVQTTEALRGCLLAAVRG